MAGHERAGEALADTVATPGASSQPGAVDPAEAPLDDAGFEARYLVRAPLGAGGMGEVELVRDARIGREVAVKLARAGLGSRSDAIARFTREARVQGQLEHPAIVPVYDLGRRPDGRVYFTMKRVRGLTLEQVLAAAARGDELGRAWSRRKLLTAFASVCQAVHFAHSRGVLHRDLKPANVMLGDFGEVYVLDWGLAKLVGEEEPSGPAAAAGAGGVASAEPAVHATTPATPATTSGAIMGTPGYMAPEQIRGEVERQGVHTDVFALGAMLFELLALVPLVPREGGVAGMMSATLAGVDARAGRRAPARDVPPELEAVCVRACAAEPAARFASVRELADAVERFLDGDRDLARRRELADEAAARARMAADAALAPGTDDAAAEAARREALAQAGRALALDPSHAGAQAAMIRLLTTPPRRLPAEAARELERAELETLRVVSIKGGWTYLTWLLLVPLALWLGLRELGPFLLWTAAVLGAAVFAFATARAQVTSFAPHFGGLCLSSVALVLTAPLFGPYLLVPVIAAVNTMAFMLHAQPAWRPATLAIGALSVVAPIAAELAGWLPRTTWVAGDAIVIRSWVLHLPAGGTEVALTLILVGTLVVPGLYVMRVRDALARAERQLTLQTWQLRQLVPAAAQEALAVRPEATDASACLLERPIGEAIGGAGAGAGGAGGAVSGSSPSRPSRG